MTESLLRVHFSEEASDEKALAATLEAIAQLPPCNKDTLAFLILHLQRLLNHIVREQHDLMCLCQLQHIQSIILL